MCLSVSRAAPCYFLSLSRRHPAWWSRRRRDTYSLAHLLSRAGTHTEVSSDTTTRSFLRSFAFTVAFFLDEETAQSVRVLLTRPRCCASLSTATPCMHVGGLFSFFRCADPRLRDVCSSPSLLFYFLPALADVCHVALCLRVCLCVARFRARTAEMHSGACSERRPPHVSL